MTAAGVRIEVDPADLDVTTVHRWLSLDAYWALGRTLDEVRRSVAGSVNVAAYVDDAFVGYARLVTDRAVFAWLCDVYVDPSARGHGVGVALVDRCVSLCDGWGVHRTLLRTRDAQSLYERYGFVDGADQAASWMVRWNG